MAKHEVRESSRQAPEGDPWPGGWTGPRRWAPLGRASLCLLLPPTITPLQQVFLREPCCP